MTDDTVAPSQPKRSKIKRQKTFKAPRPKRGAWRAAALAALVAGGGAFAAGYALAPEPTPDWAETVELAGSTIEVTEREYTGEQRITARLELSEEQSLTAPTGGVVRQIACEPGQTISSGDFLFMLDNRPIIALYTNPPMWRDLAVGMRGDDVTALQEELVRLGFTAPIDGQFRASTGLAVRALWREVGPANSTQQTLPLSQITWLENPEAVVTECLLAIGDRVSAGQPALVLGGNLNAINVPTTGLSAEDLVITAVGLDLTTPLPADGRITDRAFLDAYMGLHAFQMARQEGVLEQSLTTRLATPLGLMAVPPAALYDLSGPNGCVIADGSPLAVTVMASELGQSLIAVPSPIRTVVISPENPAPCR
ncbi:MAG: peptidoglycan-binding protein [Promicromonosporaceae bacterium]|nr:peptidoglycan-binding protein [Promicromonosporaceae bacterium]